VIAAAAVLLLIAILFAATVLFRRSAPEPEKEKPAVTPPVTAPLRQYKRGKTREETVFLTLKACGLPTLEGKWYYIGPFDNPDKKGFNTAYPPEQEIDLAKTYKGKGGRDLSWKEFKDFQPDKIINLKLFPDDDKFKGGNENAVVYLYHEMDAAEAAQLPISLGSDDTLTVWVNGEKIVSQDVYRGVAKDHARVNFNLLPGKNKLLIKVCQGTGDWAVYISYPGWSQSLESAFGPNLQRDFPQK
jgi:hypothetical protein